MTLLGVALERLAGIDAAAVAGGAIALHEVGGRGDRGGRRRDDGVDAAFLLEPTPGRLDRGGRRDGRRDAPEVDLLLPEGPDRPRHQPARMVKPDARPDPRADPRPRAQVPPSNGRPVRKDEIELHDRGLYIESWLPERRSRRKPLLFVHGELAGSWLWERYLGYFAGRGLGGPRPQPPEPLLVADRRPDDAVVRHLHRGRRRGPRPARADDRRGRARDGRLLALKAAERVPISALVLLAPGAAARPAPAGPPYELREVPEVYGRSVIGWETLPEKLLRDHRDLTLADVLRIQHLLGQKPHEAGAARRQVLARACRSTGGVAGSRGWSSAAASTGTVSSTAERLAEWLGAEYEPFGAHSHYGLVDRREQPPAGRRGDPAVPRGEPPLSRRPALARLRRGRRRVAGIHRPGDGGQPALPPVPHSSRGLGHRPLKAEITGSNPVCGRPRRAGPSPRSASSAGRGCSGRG